jgi:hypothetical protein
VKIPVGLLDGSATAFAAQGSGVPFTDHWRGESAQRGVFESVHVESEIAQASFAVARPDLGIVAEPGPGIAPEWLAAKLVIKPGAARYVGLESEMSSAS